MATRVTLEVATLRREVQDKYTEVATYPERTFHFHHGRPLAEFCAVGNQHKWDSLGPERSEVWKSLGELPEGPVMKSSPIDRLSLHLLSTL